MAAINDLISQIQDETLRNRIQEEVSKMAKQKKFGLVFEEHMPESTPLYDMPIKRGCNVMRRDSKDDKSIYVVLKIEGDTVVCVKSEQKDEAVTFELKDISLSALLDIRTFVSGCSFLLGSVTRKTPFAVSNSGGDGQFLYAHSIFSISVP